MYGEYGKNSTDPTCPENKTEDKEEKKNIKIWKEQKKFHQKWFKCGRYWHTIPDAKNVQRNTQKPKTTVKDDRKLVQKKESEFHQLWQSLLHATLLPTIHKTSMMHVINGESFFTFMKCLWISNFGKSYHITKDAMGMYSINDIDN